jgi:small-conductance mechanosensitive channel
MVRAEATMTHASDSAVPAWMAALMQPWLLWQAAAVVVCLGLAWLAHRRYAAWRARHPAAASAAPLALTAITAGRLLVIPVVACVSLLLAWGAFAALRQPDGVVRIALSLAVAFGLVRLAVYLLSTALSPGPLLRASESLIVAVVWLGVALHLLGWLPRVVDALDAAAFAVGDTRISVLLVLRALAAVLLVLVAAAWLSRLLERRVMGSRHLSASARVGISKVAKLALMTLGVLLALQVVGLDLSALAVIGGTLGLGLGLGLQRIVSNFISGFILLADRSIKPGDVVTVEDQSGSRYGWVQEMRARYVVIRDRDGVDTLMPNENLIINPVVNWSYGDPNVRLKLPVRISYDADPELAMALMEQAAVGRERVLDDPAPASRLMAFGENGIELELRVWVTSPEQGVNNVRSEINLAIWRAFREHGIGVPLPQREVRLLGGPRNADAGDAAGPAAG